MSDVVYHSDECIERSSVNGIGIRTIGCEACEAAHLPKLPATIDYRFGAYVDALDDVERVSCVITDPPYSVKTHKGHNSGGAMGGYTPKQMSAARAKYGSQVLRSIDYSAWAAEDVDRFVDFWAPRNLGWFVALSDDNLGPAWKAAYARHGLYVFQSVPIIIPGMTVRLAGDGPSSWAVYAFVARPAHLSGWGTLRGAYVLPKGYSEKLTVVGGKPLWVMQELVRDYSNPGDLVCDPCAGAGTTLRAAVTLNRMAIGSELDEKTHAKGMKYLSKSYMQPLFDEVTARSPLVQTELSFADDVEDDDAATWGEIMNATYSLPGDATNV